MFILYLVGLPTGVYCAGAEDGFFVSDLLVIDVFEGSGFAVVVSALVVCVDVAATQHIYFARHGNKVYTLIALHLDNNEEAVTKALEYTLGSMSFDNSVNT